MQTTQRLQPLAQHSASVTLAAVVTGTLFLLMHALIDSEVPDLEQTRRILIDPIMPPQEEPQVQPEQRTPKPAEPEQVPHWETPVTPMENDAAQLAGGGNFTPDTTLTRIDPGAGTSTIVPVFRIAPDYPPAALRQNIEGHVDLMFDVAPSGRTENIRVLDGQPKGVFDRAATRTLAKWKYKAPVQDGVPYGQKDMTTRITFRLED